MKKVTKETVTAVQFVQACGGDVCEAVTRLESLIDSLFIAGQRKKAESVEKILVIVKGGTL